MLSDDDGVKFWYWGSALKADRVVLDPELTVALPAHLTAATGVDALVHAIEACTNRNAFVANDLYGLEAIRLVARHLATAVSEPGNLEARGGMLRAASLAGIAIDNVGTALAHNIGHALGSLMPIHHGRAVAIAMAATLPWNVEGDGVCTVKVGTAGDGERVAVGTLVTYRCEPETLKVGHDVGRSFLDPVRTGCTPECFFRSQLLDVLLESLLLLSTNRQRRVREC